MAIGALVPFALVLAAVNGEIFRIVLVVFCRHPGEIGGVAFHAILGESRKHVVGICSGLVFRGMTGNTLRACFRKNHRFVARPAIHPGMLTGQGEIGFAVFETKGILSACPVCHFGFFYFVAFVEFPFFNGDIPPVRRMTGSAIDLKVCTVRRLRKQAH